MDDVHKASQKFHVLQQKVEVSKYQLWTPKNPRKGGRGRGERGRGEEGGGR